MIACKDCKFYRRPVPGSPAAFHECMRDPINVGYDVISGEARGQSRNAALERIGGDGCGIEAKYFEPKRRWWQISKGETK